jgi:hypothetical protein
MAADKSSTTGADVQGDVRRRNVGNNQLNGNGSAQELAEKVQEKTKKQVCIKDPS